MTLAFHPKNPSISGEDNTETIRIWDIENEKCSGKIHIPRPYENMNISGIKGLTEAQKDTLKTLGAIDL